MLKGADLLNLLCHAAQNFTNTKTMVSTMQDDKKKCCCLLVSELTPHYLLHVGVGFGFVWLWHFTQTSTVGYLDRWYGFRFLVCSARSFINLYRSDLFLFLENEQTR